MELINPKFKQQKKSIWVIIHVNIDNLYRIDKDIDKFISRHRLPANSVSAYIPTVRVLRKKLKGTFVFETIPLLFTYGFIQIPRSFCTHDQLMALKSHVNSIHSYVTDISNGRVAFATHDEIKKLFGSLKDYSVYDKADLEKLEVNKLITLHGYPFDNMIAKIIKVNHETEKVKVEIMGDGLIKTSEVDFDNIIWSCYHQPQDPSEFKEVLFGDLKTQYKTNTTKYE
jgi:transcription antitermination factor NusG